MIIWHALVNPRDANPIVLFAVGLSLIVALYWILEGVLWILEGVLWLVGEATESVRTAWRFLWGAPTKRRDW